MSCDERVVSRLAEIMISQYGFGAARAAVERLNAMIDRHDWRRRDQWACVVRAIHAELGVTSPGVWPTSYAASEASAPRAEN
jgi:hypothetical protein